jgi:hypothetical protein
LISLGTLLVSSGKRLSAFFALVSADLAVFSAATLAEVAISQAFLEASSSASRDVMRALAAVKASIVQNRKRKVE